MNEIKLHVGSRVILPADDEAGVPAQRAEYLGDEMFRVHPQDREFGDVDGLVEIDPELLDDLKVLS